MYFLFFLHLHLQTLYFFSPPRRLVSHFGSSFKTSPFHQFNKEVHSDKPGCHLKRLFFLDSFQQLSPVAIKKCLDSPISLTSVLGTCISPSLVCLYLCCNLSFSRDTSRYILLQILYISSSIPWSVWIPSLFCT